MGPAAHTRSFPPLKSYPLDSSLVPFLPLPLFPLFPSHFPHLHSERNCCVHGRRWRRCTVGSCWEASVVHALRCCPEDALSCSPARAPMLLEDALSCSPAQAAGFARQGLAAASPHELLQGQPRPFFS
ncbi:hypothetical protein ACQJBY_036592 [Aegilops geniculata]